MTHLNSKNVAAATPVDYASIARIASAVELRDIALRSSRAVLNVAANEIPERWSGNAFVGFDTTVGEHRPESKDFTIRAAFVAVYKSSWGDEILSELPELDPDDPPEIEIQATFELTYRTADGAELADEDLDNFALANGTLHAWPYWRELADDITTRMHVPRLVVGVFKIPSKHDPGGREQSPADEQSAASDAEAAQQDIESAPEGEGSGAAS
jgi:hypothetical protein